MSGVEEARSHRSTKERDAPGFSLIELLMVVSVIAILAGLVVASSGYITYKAAESRTRAEIEALCAALENYSIDNGGYPEALVHATGSQALIKALMPSTANVRQGAKIYYEFPPAMLTDTNQPEVGYLVDPFNNRYQYQFPGNPARNGSNFYDLWSFGKRNNESNQAKWIKNW